VLRIRIRRIRMFLSLLDPDPLVRGMDPQIRIRIHTKMSWIRNTWRLLIFNVRYRVDKYLFNFLVEEEAIFFCVECVIRGFFVKVYQHSFWMRSS
jgi:hypothetical protein